jgi:hypothetical protein
MPSLLTNMEPWLRIYTDDMVVTMFINAEACLDEYRAIREKLLNGTYTPRVYKDEDGGDFLTRKHTIEFCDREIVIASSNYKLAAEELKRRGL